MNALLYRFGDEFLTSAKDLIPLTFFVSLDFFPAFRRVELSAGSQLASLTFPRIAFHSLTSPFTELLLSPPKRHIYGPRRLFNVVFLLRYDGPEFPFFPNLSASG